MREIRRLFCLVIALTFVGGLGTGAWVGTLMAGPEPRPATVDERISDFREVFPDLTGSQVRRIRLVLAEYDHDVAKIREELSAEQLRRKFEVERLRRDELRGILTEPQREEYDTRLRRK